MSTEFDSEYNFLVFGCTEDKRSEIEHYLDNTTEIEGSNFKGNSEQCQNRDNMFNERRLLDLFKGKYTALVFYIMEPSDVPVIVPLIEVYRDYPIKVIIHEPGIPIPENIFPDIKRIPKGAIEETFKTIAAERRKVDEEIVKIFLKIDYDHSGKIDANKLVKASIEFGNPITPEKAMKMAEKEYIDNDKMLSLDEFKMFWYSGQKLFDLKLSEFLQKKHQEEIKGELVEKVSGHTAVCFGKPLGINYLYFFLQNFLQ